MFLYAKTITEMYPRLLKACLEADKVTTRGNECREIIDMSFVIEDVSQPFVLQKARKLNYAYCILEPILLTMPQNYNTVDACNFYVGKFLKANVINPSTQMMDGWYGDRINHLGSNLLLKVFEILKQDPQSRRAVLTIHNSKDELERNGSMDKPCTLDLQFLIRDGMLDCIVNMRANDVMLGTPQNFAMWTFFQRMLAKWLGIPAGRYHHRVGSFHLYERNVDKAFKIIETAAIMIEEAQIYSHGWDWPISDPIESLRQCCEFAFFEKLWREHCVAIPDHTNFDHTLKTWLEVIIFPYIDLKDFQ